MNIRDTWSTPKDFRAWLKQYYAFDIDVCADKSNTLCEKFYSVEDDGLSQPWHGNVWCNPPYSEPQKWHSKAYMETCITHNCKYAVVLTHACTGARWWHTMVNKANVHIVLLCPRIQFVPPKGILASSNARDSILTVYKSNKDVPKLTSVALLEWKPK